MGSEVPFNLYISLFADCNPLDFYEIGSLYFQFGNGLTPALIHRSSVKLERWRLSIPAMIRLHWPFPSARLVFIHVHGGTTSVSVFFSFGVQMINI